ncbi:MAG: hypothetical protein KF832_18980 [Caldilineaceae bacterium]|nr:hypothetical protein [Caldilineaceae bacterium]
MRTKLQGRRSLLLWFQYMVILIAVAAFGFVVQSWRLLPTLGGAEETPTVVRLPTEANRAPRSTPTPAINPAAATQTLPTATPTLDWVATAIEETVVAAAAITPTSTEQPTATQEPTPTATQEAAPTASAVPTVPSSLTQLRTQVLAATRNSRIRNTYPQQSEQFVNALLDHLADFQLPTLGITSATMQQALKRSDVGDRINALVQEVWGDWSWIASDKKFDPYTRTPTLAEHNLSPFRQLVIRLIQGKQGKLIDNQQHGLHNFLTRSENASVWSSNIDGVIGAVNRSSFLWP